jgi:2-dehydropantoate 2-reductase
MENKIKIAIAGIGGIGGYIGGKLAHCYFNSDDIHISFICRGEQRTAIKENGLELLSNNQTVNCYAHLVSENPIEIGKLEVLIICVKNFTIEELLIKYADCITPNTVVITTQNTVNGNETIAPFLPKDTTLLEGVIYISSNAISPGKVHHVSGPSKLFFGTNGNNDVKAEYIAEILNKAGIDTTFTTNINSILWKKFIFVSPAAIVTAMYQITFSEIMQRQEARELYINLILELMQLAKVKNIDVDENTIENNCKLLGNFAPTVKSSFQLDLEKKKRTEINSLVHYVIAESKNYGIIAANYKCALNELIQQYELHY